MARVPVTGAGAAGGHPGFLAQPLAWLREGWQALRDSATSALTYFAPGRSEADAADPDAASPRWGVVACDLDEQPDAVVVEFEVPGMDRDDLRVDVVGDTLLVSGEKRRRRTRRDHGRVITERAYGRFERAVMLPCPVVRDGAQASYEDGVLSVTLPKAGRAAARRIPVDRG